jgi:hypothetical protein
VQNLISDFEPLKGIPNPTHRIAVVWVVVQFDQFFANQELTRRPSHLQSAVADDVLQSFVAAIESNAVDISERNHAELSQLCEEFGFDCLSDQLSMLQPAAALRNADARRRRPVLEDQSDVSKPQFAER